MVNKVYHVKLSIHPNNKGCNRQLPGRSYQWKNFIFHINEKIDKADFWVVYSKGLSIVESCLLPRRHTLFITGEPETTYHYSTGFINQFNKVLSVQNSMRHPNVEMGQPGLPWYIGKITKKDVVEFSCDFDSINKNHPRKEKLLSLITSNKRFTKGHNDRIRFTEILKEHYGDSLDIFGHGFNDFDDKATVLEPYKYHICIENSSYPHYWSEKLADCFLAETFPFYYGAPNLHDYFQTDSFLSIDINNPERAIDIIDNAIANNKFENSYQAIIDAKHKVLNEYNLFEVIARQLMSIRSDDKSEMVILKPDTSFFDIKKVKVMIIDRIKNKIFH